jgi:hypothetical protein
MSEQPEVEVAAVPVVAVVDAERAEEATETATVAADLAVGAAETSADAAATADFAAQEASAASDTAAQVAERQLSTDEKFDAMRAELGDVRGWIMEQRDKERAAEEAANQAPEHEEVPVNDAAKRDAENRDSGESAGETKTTADTASKPEVKTTPPRGGLRRRHR